MGPNVARHVTVIAGARHPHDQAPAEDLRLSAHLIGAKQFCAIRSYLSTTAKHGTHFFEALVMLAKGRPRLPVTP